MKRNYVRKLILFLITIALISGCITQKKCNQKFPCTGKTDTVIFSEFHEVLKDTTIFLKDSSTAQLLMACDSIGNIYLKEIIKLKAGKYVTPSVIFKDKILYVNCNIDSGAIVLHYKDKFLKTYQTINKTVVTKENYLTSWQWFQVWWGRIMGLLLLCLAIYFGLRLYFKKKSVL
jgi:hypothetical protein